jgi:DNA-directed RNA polymerase beta subunit
MFCSTYYRTFSLCRKEEEGSYEIKIPNPRSCLDMREDANYEKLRSNDRTKELNGVIQVGARVKDGDVLIGRVLNLQFPKKKKTVKGKDILCTEKDASLYFKGNEEESGFVDRVYYDPHERIYHIKIRTLRIPELGDKFAEISGQKGTVGLIVPQEDMPRNAQGITPDIIFNPAGIPSRMTIGYLMELLCGKGCAIQGRYGDATPFGEMTIEKLLDESRRGNFVGKEQMYCGKTGELLENAVFMGVGQYQRLKHMVVDKIHARDKGPINQLTRQSTDGRSKDGGLKMGNMEVDVIVAHGVSNFLSWKFTEDADKAIVTICEKCGLIVNAPDDEPSCQTCRTLKPSFCRVNITHAFKLLVQELMALGISVRIRVN